MKIQLTIKQLIWIIVAVISITSLIYGSVFVMITLSKQGYDWMDTVVAATGNVIGGILGGLVAYIVAAYQVNRTFENEKYKQVRKSINMLKLIREELRDNITTLESAIPYENSNFVLLKNQLTDDTWKSSLIFLTISDQLLVKLNVVYKKVSLLKNLEKNDINDQILKDTMGQFEGILDDITQEVEINNKITE